MVRRFDIITEADARGSTRRDGGVGPRRPRHAAGAGYAQRRRVSVVPAGSVDPTLPDDLAPLADIRRVAIGSDHTGVALKTAIVEHLRGAGWRSRSRHGRRGPG